MSKFASDCLAKLEVLTKSLADSLGPDTATLQLRVGLHSGSVTGGVLRGQKSRFQLFGDTMVSTFFCIPFNICFLGQGVDSHHPIISFCTRTLLHAWKVTARVGAFMYLRKPPRS